MYKNHNYCMIKTGRHKMLVDSCMRQIINATVHTSDLHQMLSSLSHVSLPQNRFALLCRGKTVERSFVEQLGVRSVFCDPGD